MPPLREDPLELVPLPLRDRGALLREPPDFDPPPERDELDRGELDRDELDRGELVRDELRPDDVPLRERPPDERLLELELVERDRPDVPELLLERLRLLDRRRVVAARSERGISARTTSLTSRPSSASRNFAMRSSSRLIALASRAVSLSPTASANVWMRE